jgi:hypothetical protein
VIALRSGSAWTKVHSILEIPLAWFRAVAGFNGVAAARKLKGSTAQVIGPVGELLTFKTLSPANTKRLVPPPLRLRLWSIESAPGVRIEHATGPGALGPANDARNPPEPRHSHLNSLADCQRTVARDAKALV